MIHHDSKIQDSGSGSGVLCGRQHGRAPVVFCDPGSCSRSGGGKSVGCTSFGQPGWMSLLQPEWTALERWTTGPGRLLEPGPTAPLLGRRRPGTGAAELKKRGVKEFTPPVAGHESRAATLIHSNTPAQTGPRFPSRWAARLRPLQIRDGDGRSRCPFLCSGRPGTETPRGPFP